MPPTKDTLHYISSEVANIFWPDFVRHTLTWLHRVCLDLTNVQSTVTGGVALFSSQEIGVSFDKRHIVSLLEALVRFPHNDKKLEGKRKWMKFGLECDRNPVLWVGWLSVALPQTPPLLLYMAIMSKLCPFLSTWKLYVEIDFCSILPASYYCSMCRLLTTFWCSCNFV